MAAAAGSFDAENQFIQRRTSISTDSDEGKKVAPAVDPGCDLEGAQEKDRGMLAKDTFNKRFRIVILIALAALILGWWISSTILPATRGQWGRADIFRVVFLTVPWYKLPRVIRLTIGWLCLLTIVSGSAFGFPLTGQLWTSSNLSAWVVYFPVRFLPVVREQVGAICWPTVIVGLFLQQTIALFVLKACAGFSFFKYVADLANDFLSEALVGAEFFFDAETIAKKWFFVNVLSAVIFFIATIQMLYYLGVMQWMVKGFAWLFYQLTLQLVLGYIGYPIALFLGVPSDGILRVSQSLATKLVANKFAAYLELSSIQASSNPLSQCAFKIASYSLCGFANLGSLGIQIGVLGALAPSQGRTIATSAMFCGFLSNEILSAEPSKLLASRGYLYGLGPDV
ncbi:Na+ dependent nucleoside transporter C-terminus-domain-containing protein [Suillus spraguei]|nr:Na+ dependent nucleoside transporter C-terminus-domain-containing protein [Suillus spraguei]